MQRLRGKSIDYNLGFEGRKVFKVTRNRNLPEALTNNCALISDTPPETTYPMWISNLPPSNDLEITSDRLMLPKDLDYLTEGDIISISDRGDVTALFRTSTNYNTFLLTERCNHYCLMCSQPPKDVQDDWLLQQTFDAIRLIPKWEQRIGFSGGEPSIYGQKLISLVDQCRAYLPDTMIDILSNGRAFANTEYAKSLGNVGHKACMVCVPLYSHVPEIHNFVVQSEHAFDETIEGIMNLKAVGVQVEIRIVIHNQTIDSLVDTCTYIANNLRFVDHVALMGLEITGFTRANLDQLWIDPFDYKDQLSQAVRVLRSHGLTHSVYNHQLCTINSDTVPSYAKSISDWKNEYLPQCGECSKKSECGGFFSSGILYKHSDHIKPFDI